MPLNVLVVGAGVCGPAFASLLQGSDARHNITVVERSSSLRVAGQQIDLKAQGTPIVKKMGLLDDVKRYCVAETGLEIVDPKGKAVASFGVNSSAGFGLTVEIEIMRGDLVRVLHDASLKQRAKIAAEGGREGGLKYEFGKTVKELSQDSGDGVDVTFSDGEHRRFDLVVAADGQGSRTRRLAFGDEANSEAIKSLGIHVAYYSIPRGDGDGGLAKAFFAPGSRAVMLRNGDRPQTQVYLYTSRNPERLKTLYKEPVAAQKAYFADTFRDAGWESERLVAGMAATDDFYAHELAQIKMQRGLVEGRVVLVGDAGYCPTPFTGMGTTAALIGAWVLAGELARRPNDVGAALQAYNDVMRAPVDECQVLPASMTKGLPSSSFGVWLIRTSLWAMSTFKIEQLLHKIWPEREGPKKGSWPVPEYPELKLD
jgi:2-polyprenyl-6-methoxyphenol hydroxylase-like FAD-dependent oxidoreductase